MTSANFPARQHPLSFTNCSRIYKFLDLHRQRFQTSMRPASAPARFHKILYPHKGDSTPTTTSSLVDNNALRDPGQCRRHIKTFRSPRSLCIIQGPMGLLHSIPKGFPVSTTRRSRCTAGDKVENWDCKMWVSVVIAQHQVTYKETRGQSVPCSAGHLHRHQVTIAQDPPVRSPEDRHENRNSQGTPFGLEIFLQVQQ